MIKRLLTLVAAAAAVSFGASADTLPLDLSNLNSGWGSSYDAATKTITYESDWSGRGWWLDGVDYSAYDEFVLEFEPVEFTVKPVVEYTAEGAVSSEATASPGKDKVVVALDEAYKNSVKQIYIQNSAVGTLTIKAAYLQNAVEVDPTVPVVLFEGERNLAWSGSNNTVDLDITDFIAAKVAEGDKLVVEYSAIAGNGFKVIYVSSGWEWTIMPFMTSLEGYSTEYQTINLNPDNNSAEFTLAADDVAILTNSANHGVKIQGADVTVKKVSIVHKSAGISDIVVDENAPVEYYNLQGVRVANPENGLYIRRQGNKATKVLVK